MTEHTPEEWLGQILIDGKWMDYARGHEGESRRWQRADPAKRRLVHWISRDVLVPDTLTIARRWVNSDVVRVFEAEIANEANGGITPSTLSSTIDSIQQMPEDILGEMCDNGSPWLVLTSLLALRDLLPGDTEIRELVG